MRAIPLILMTSVLASVSAPTVQAQVYLEGDGFVFDNGELYLVPEGSRYSPPPDLADHVSPPEDFYESPRYEPRTQPYAEPGTGMGLDYFPPAPVNDTKVETTVTVPVTKQQVTVIEAKPELKEEPIKKVVVDVPATDTKLTVETQKVETATRRVRVVGGDDITRLASHSEQFLPHDQKTGDGFKWFFLILIIAVIIGCGFFFRSLVEKSRRRSTPVEEERPTRHVPASSTRWENSQLRASLTKIREGVAELMAALLGKPRVPLLPPPDNMTHVPPT
ncbi:MAG: hypothetical protein DI628_02065 [Blastochloris viridis]|uniref:Uncharacterized protein n=1 Tax=Blastochloris viridis TaxID=1079 RepID=A0A6N4RDQ0_BLAVI|nr:MAG: hypothetical protein DI628_02065 [Blastochloris viridis]